MEETFEQKKRLSEQHFRSSSPDTDETTPKEVTAHIREFATALGGPTQFVPVRQDEFGLYGWCSDGVLEKIKRDGGDIVFGWTIWEWPKIFLTAEFHAVWGDPTGHLVDITPKPSRESEILFVADLSYPSTFNFDNRPTNRRFRLPQEPDYIAQARIEIGKMKNSQIEYETKRAARNDVSLLDWIAAKQPRATFPALVDQLIAVCDAVDKKTDQLAGNGRTFFPDREYRDLTKRKLSLLTTVKAAANRN